MATVFENLQDMGIEEVMEHFEVTREQIESVLEFVVQSLDATDADDLQTAQERLADPQPGITSHQLRQHLGLEV
jgi:DNA gyrase/topoisomerase IV subunit A